jgi:hypothetical protein
MRAGGLFAAVAVLISVLCACNGHAGATPALPISNAAVRMPGMLADIPDAKTGENIYIANSASNDIVTYTTAGKATKPTITVSLNEPTGVAVDAQGKIYVSNAFTSNVTT